MKVRHPDLERLTDSGVRRAGRTPCILLFLLAGLELPGVARAQAVVIPRVEVSAGLGTGDSHVLGPSVLGSVAVRVVSAGPVDWRVVGAVHRRLSFLETGYVSTGVPNADTSEVQTLFRGGLEVRVNAFKGRLAPTIGAGTSYGRWHDLPPNDAGRSAMRSVYRSAGVMIGLRRRVTVELLAINWRSVLHGDDATHGALSVRIPLS